MASGDLENALRLRRLSPGFWAAYADPNYESANGMFGGWTSAIALRAVCDEANSDASPCSLTIDFVSKIEPGSEVVIETRRVGEGRSVGFWQSELKVADATMAVASVVLTKRRETDGHIGITMPDAPDPSTLELIFPAPAASGERFRGSPVRRISTAPPGRHVHDRLGARDERTHNRSSPAGVTV